MAEYIEREAIVKHIDLWHSYLVNAYGYHDQYAKGFEACCDTVENFPTVDAVHVVRCKDCKYLYDELDDYCCMSHRGLVRICENSFCSYGERRKE